MLSLFRGEWSDSNICILLRQAFLQMVETKDANRVLVEFRI
jgi:hypothetical protein